MEIKSEDPLANKRIRAEDRIGIGMIENKKGVESWGVRAWEWAGKVRGWEVWVFGQGWKVRGDGRGKCLGVGFESAWKVRGLVGVESDRKV